MPSHRLSKSKYIRGLQCHKALYLDVYRRNLAVIDEATRTKFAEGRTFEKSFKDTFPNAFDISKLMGPRIDRYPYATAELLSQPGELSLLEAGFVHNEILILADVFHRDAHNHITVFEVKNSTQPKEVFLNDIAIQYHVISHCIPHLDHFYLVYNDGNDGFLKLDLLNYAQQQQPLVVEQVNTMKQIIQGTEPAIPMGDHCQSPYKCPYQEYCRHATGQTELSF